MNNIPFLSLKDVTALHGAEINEAVTRVVNRGWYLQGEENEQFEQNYSKFISCKYTIGCANGLDALIWIFRAYIEMGVMQPGDEVIVPANTYIATVLAITENNLVPVFIEPKANTLEIDDSLICEIEEEVANAKNATFLLGGKMKEVYKFDLYEQKRSFVVIDKVKGTPKTYPRKAGTPTKTPL